MSSQEELVQDVLKALEKIDRDDPASDKLSSYLYIPDSRMSEYLIQLDNLLKISKPKKAELRERGKTLEQIVCLAFNSLKGVTSLKSFQSAGPQYDLLITGDTIDWNVICKQLYIDTPKRDIVVEAKARKEKLQDKDFARLCSIMELNLTGASLGIFFTLNGATGFPQRNCLTRQRKISDCRLRQVIYYAKTNKFVVVLDKQDIFELNRNGSLIQILTRKIRDLRELSGFPTTSVNDFKEIDLPGHLSDLV